MNDVLVMKRRYYHHPEVDRLPSTPCPEAFYSSVLPAVVQNDVGMTTEWQRNDYLTESRPYSDPHRPGKSACKHSGRSGQTLNRGQRETYKGGENVSHVSSTAGLGPSCSVLVLVCFFVRFFAPGSDPLFSCEWQKKKKKKKKSIYDCLFQSHSTKQ